MRLKISEILDPMELSNNLATLMKSISDNEYLLKIVQSSLDIAKDITHDVSTSVEANRGAVIVSAYIMEMLTQIMDLIHETDEEEAFMVIYTTFSVGIPSVLLSFMCSENVVNAKIKDDFDE